MPFETNIMIPLRELFKRNEFGELANPYHEQRVDATYIDGFQLRLEQLKAAIIKGPQALEPVSAEPKKKINKKATTGAANPPPTAPVLSERAAKNKKRKKKLATEGTGIQPPQPQPAKKQKLNNWSAVPPPQNRQRPGNVPPPQNRQRPGNGPPPQNRQRPGNFPPPQNRQRPGNVPRPNNQMDRIRTLERELEMMRRQLENQQGPPRNNQQGGGFDGWGGRQSNSFGNGAAEPFNRFGGGFNDAAPKRFQTNTSPGDLFGRFSGNQNELNQPFRGNRNTFDNDEPMDRFDDFDNNPRGNGMAGGQQNFSNFERRNQSNSLSGVFTGRYGNFSN